MTCCSAILSFVSGFLFFVDSFFLPNIAKRGQTGLSGPQRVFVIQITTFIFWLSVFGPSHSLLTLRGATVFFRVERFTFAESVYFVDVTVTTVGFGDGSCPATFRLPIVVPTTNLGRAIVMPYAIIGILSLGLVVSSIRTVLVERAHVRKRSMDRTLRKQQNRLDFLENYVQRFCQ
jgi:potassium channel subfamily K, other eukaryote